MIIKEKDNRLFLQHGPIDIVVEAIGKDKYLAYEKVKTYFKTLLSDLVLELELLKKEVQYDRQFTNQIAQKMQQATQEFHPDFITPMAAVAGSVADSVLEVLTSGFILEKAYVNNGGDVSFYLNKGQSMKSSLASMPDTFTEIKYEDKSRGVATSGWRGRSFSLGIADSVTVLANNAAMADAAATMIANSVDLKDHHLIKKKYAQDLNDNSDLFGQMVTTEVGELSQKDIIKAINNGHNKAKKYLGKNLINSALIQLSDCFCIVQKTSSTLNIINKSTLKQICFE
jgi:ApbE superfamily uncharacterized protein (UPF0280 family)